MPSIKDTIRSISYNQHEILYNIMQMHNNGEPYECDMTYSKGAFYGDFDVTDINGERQKFSIPRPKHTFDVAPQDELTKKIEPEGSLPLDDNSIRSMVIDLPFVISVGPSMKTPDYDENGKRVMNNVISRRFAAYYPVKQLLESYHHWLKESYRVLEDGGLLVFKCQKTITGGKSLNTPEYSWLIAECLGFDMIDSFMLLAKARLISGKVNKQQHSRRFESEFLVFRKSLRKKIRYLSFLDDELAAGLMQGFVENNIDSKHGKRNRVK